MPIIQVANDIASPEELAALLGRSFSATEEMAAVGRRRHRACVDSARVEWEARISDGRRACG